MSGWIAGAIVVGTVGSAVIGSSAASSAADQQAQGGRNALAFQERQFNTINQQEQPFLQSGYGALNQLDYLLGIPQSNAQGGGQSFGGQPNGPRMQGQFGDMNGNFRGIPGGGNFDTSAGGGQGGQTGSGQTGAQTGAGQAGGFGSLNAPFTADTFKQYSPAYQFGLQQGGQGVLNQDSANQGAESGSALKDLISFNSNYANMSFNNAFNQYQTQQSNTYNRLSGLAQIGSSAAANLGAQGVQLAGNAGSAAANIAASQAAGTIGSANAISSGFSNASSALPWLMSGSSAPWSTPQGNASSFGVNR